MSVNGEQKLKASVSISYKINLGNYQSADFWVRTDFFLGESNLEEELSRLDQRLLDWLEGRGIRPTIARSSHAGSVK